MFISFFLDHAGRVRPAGALDVVRALLSHFRILLFPTSAFRIPTSMPFPPARHAPL